MTEEDRKRLVAIVDRFEGIPMGLVGDMVADLYVLGRPGRVSREAPVLVLVHERDELIPGGAANTAANLHALGARVCPVGVLGNDEPGRAIVRYFEERGVSTDGLVLTDAWRTVTKTRILAGAPSRLKHQIVRVDHEPAEQLDSAVRQEILGRVRTLAPEVRGWVFSDYGYGAAAPGVGAMLDGVRVADSRSRIGEYRGFTALTPNDEEASEFVGHPVLTDGQVRAAARKIIEAAEAENVVVTRGNLGMAVFVREGGELFVPASGGEEVTDVTGAGDTVTGVLALALAAGADAFDAVRLANHAAGVVVTKAGAATLTREELAARLREEA
jgi:rfaE bifunctional protein kinase chain/domain